jgi:glucose-6-phosphate-specific signal transduction histidine kinase
MWQNEGHALGMVVTDLSEQKRKQAEEINQAEAIHRLLLERVLVAQEEERRRIARKLHDEVGQLLTSLLVGLRFHARMSTACSATMCFSCRFSSSSCRSRLASLSSNPPNLLFHR